MPSQNAIIMPIDSESYYALAIKALNNDSISDALSYIDMAISLSAEKPLYVFYKIKLLYLANLQDDCIDLILTQFHYLYINCCLNDFCLLLNYYQNLTQCTCEDLAETLKLHNLPSILAFEYALLSEDEDYNFHSKALEYKKLGNLYGCIDCCEIALKLLPHSVSLLHLQADCYVYLEKSELAINLYEQILTLYPLTSEIAYPLAKAYMHTNNFSKAISYFKHFIHTMPSHIDALSNLGDCYIKSKDYSNALILFKKLIDLEPLTATYYLKIGEIYTLINRKYLAQKYYRKANRLQETTPNLTLKSRLSQNLSLKSIFIIFLLMSLQFFLFKSGTIPPLIYDVNVTVDNPTIPINGFTDFQISYKFFPCYAKPSSYTVTSSTPSIANIIEGLDSLNGLSQGTCTFNVTINNKLRTQFIVNVVSHSSSSLNTP